MRICGSEGRLVVVTAWWEEGRVVTLGAGLFLRTCAVPKEEKQRIILNSRR
jgi:hypothetical protein